MVLSRLGSLIAASVRATDVVARYGGEEFAILMAHAGAKEAGVVCQRLCDRIASHPFEVNADEEGIAPLALEVTVSIGVGEWGDAADGPEGLLTRADRALYEAKAKGRNQVCFATSEG